MSLLPPTSFQDVCFLGDHSRDHKALYGVLVALAIKRSHMDWRAIAAWVRSLSSDAIWFKEPCPVATELRRD